MCGGFVGDILDGVGDLIEGVVDVVEDIGSGIDDFVHDVIPGGWGGVAGLGLLAVGIANPALLGLAEGGALTSEAIAAAGLDAAAVAEAVATVAPEVLAATEAAVASGIAPEVIAMANATLDPIAALSAAQGWTTADAAYLASIGATPELIATATANNAAIAASEAAAAETAAAETAATTGAETTAGTTTAADGSTTQIFDDGSTLTTAADGTVSSTPATDAGVATGGNTQVFDDGSTLTTNPDGTISATDTAGNPTATLVSPGGPGQAPVYDASVTAVPGAGAGTPDPTLGTALGNYASAVYDTLGPLGTAALLGGGAALASGLTGGSATGGPDNRTVNYEWGTATPLQTGPLNSGLLQQAASQPFYQTTNPTDAQFYWGARNVVNKPEDIANFNNIPGAPATPWGAGKTAVGGQLPLNVPNFVNQYITNPALAGVMSGAGQGLAPQPVPQPAVMPPMSMAQQAIAARTSGGAAIPNAVIEQPMMPSYFGGAPGAQLSLPGPVVPA